MPGSLLVRQERLRQLSHSRPILQALTRRVRSSWPVLVILLLPILLLSPSLFGGHAPTATDILLLSPPWATDLHTGTPPQNLLLSDEAYQGLPWLFFTRQEFAAGRFPLWDPYVAGGTPFFAASQPAVLWPLTLLATWLPLPWGLTLGTLLTWWGAGVGQYVFARVSLALRPFAALVSAVAWMLSSFVVVWLIHPVGRPAMLLPWLCWASERLLRNPSVRRMSILAGFVGLLSVAGHPEMQVHVLLGASLYALCLGLTLPGRSWLRRWAGVGWWSGGILLGLGLAAIQTLPTLLLLPASQTTTLRAGRAISGFVPWSGLLTWIAPNLWGNPALQTTYWGPGNYNEAVFYAGAGTLVLALIGLGTLGQRVRRNEVALFASLALVGGTLLYGMPPGSWITQLPLVQEDGWARLNVLVIFSVCVLAGIGMDQALGWSIPRRTSGRHRRPLLPPWLQPRSSQVWRLLWLGGMGGVLVLGVWVIQSSNRPADLTLPQHNWVLFWLSLSVTFLWGTAAILLTYRLGWLGRPAMQAAVLTLLLAELGLFAAPYTPQPPASLVAPRMPTLTRLVQTVGSARIAAAGPILPPDSTLSVRLHDLRAYEPTASERYLAYMLALDPSLQGNLLCCRVLRCPSPTLLSVASVAYYATLPEVDANRCAPLAPGQSLTPGPLIPLWTQGGITLWRNTLARPRFYFADTVIPSTGEPQTLAALPTLSAVGHDAIIEGGGQVSQASAEQGTIKVVADLPGEITLRTQTAAPRWLIVDEGYDPGWQAEVDGIQKTIHPANEMFQAIMVPAGTHTLHLIYRSLPFIAGMLLSSLALLTMLGLLLGDWMLRKRRSMPPLPQQNNTQPGDERLS